MITYSCFLTLGLPAELNEPFTFVASGYWQTKLTYTKNRSEGQDFSILATILIKELNVAILLK